MKNFKLLEITAENLKVGSTFVCPDLDVEYEVIAIRDSEIYNLEVVYHSIHGGFFCAELSSFIDSRCELSRFKLKVPTEPIPFDHELFKTGKYNGITREGKPVDVFVSQYRLDSEEVTTPIIFVEKDGDYLTCRKNGRFHNEEHRHSHLDLFLIEKDLT